MARACAESAPAWKWVETAILAARTSGAFARGAVGVHERPQVAELGHRSTGRVRAAGALVALQVAERQDAQLH